MEQYTAHSAALKPHFDLTSGQLEALENIASEIATDAKKTTSLQFINTLKNQNVLIHSETDGNSRASNRIKRKNFNKLLAEHGLKLLNVRVNKKLESKTGVPFKTSFYVLGDL